jgi:hypothetical protein
LLYYKVLSLLALLKLSRQAFNERLREEQEALAALTQRASEQAATAAGGACGSEKEELKELVKAATFSGYRLAELKRERGTQSACVTALLVQKYNFCTFSGYRLAELKKGERYSVCLLYWPKSTITDAYMARRRRGE